MLEIDTPPQASTFSLDTPRVAVRGVASRAIASEVLDARGESCCLGQLWQDLAMGSLSIVDWCCDTERCYLMMQQANGSPERSLLPRDREFLERGLLGESEKVLAIENGLSVSTVAGRLAVALRKLGLEPGASRVPILVAIAVHAARGQTALRDGRSAQFHLSHTSMLVVSASRPTLPRTLTLAERQVLGLLVEGYSNAQVAAARNTSVRTVANQLAAIFGKLGVSGRRSLLSHLLRSEAHVRPRRKCYSLSSTAHLAVDAAARRVIRPPVPPNDAGFGDVRQRVAAADRSAVRGELSREWPDRPHEEIASTVDAARRAPNRSKATRSELEGDDAAG